MDSHLQHHQTLGSVRAFSKSRGTGSYTDDIPASMKGNSYHFYIKIYGGQYLNAQMQMTLVKS